MNRILPYQCCAAITVPDVRRRDRSQQPVPPTTFPCLGWVDYPRVT